MNRQAPETRLIELIVRTRLDTPSPDDVVELQSLLQDPRLRRLYLELMNLQGHLETVHTRQAEQAGNDRLAEVDSEDILLALRQTEEDAPVVRYPKFEWEADPSTTKHQADGLTLRATASAVSYLLRSQVKKHRVLISSVAAVLVLGAVLSLSLLSGPDETEPPPEITGTPTTQNAKPVVATLTDTRNALWSGSAEGALVPGSLLRAGDRFTLNQGFATITTQRGAIAILEAPATIELIDHDNALRLQSGRLLGICEAPSSKGFLVRTPHMDITDLGTRFGVDAELKATEVHVFEGEVQAAHPEALADIKRVTLVASQSARTSEASREIESISHDTDRFAAIRRESVFGGLFQNTVVDTDLNGTEWLITTSEPPGTTTYAGNEVTCTVDNSGFDRTVVGGNAYGFVQRHTSGAGAGQPATATGVWAFSNLPAGRYDVATAWDRSGGNAIRYTVNGVEVLVDQSATPSADTGPAFADNIRRHSKTGLIQFLRIRSSVIVPEGGAITVTIDNSNTPISSRSQMDSVAVTLVPEATQD
ncbi:MAG: FecR domain-containing protein [Planctomycetota bacterium]